MVSKSLKDFYDNWSKKSAAIDGGDLASVYDKYITSFVIFNALYNEMLLAPAINGEQVPKKVYDNKAATEWVAKFLGYESLLNVLSEQHSKDIEAITKLIEMGIFSIKLSQGKSNRSNDLKILKNLKSSNTELRIEAILQVIYYVRCNLFHGHKDFKEYQRLLVEPLTSILVSVTVQLFNRLNGDQ